MLPSAQARLAMASHSVLTAAVPRRTDQSRSPFAPCPPATTAPGDVRADGDLARHSACDWSRPWDDRGQAPVAQGTAPRPLVGEGSPKARSREAPPAVPRRPAPCPTRVARRQVELVAARAPVRAPAPQVRSVRASPESLRSGTSKDRLRTPDIRSARPGPHHLPDVWHPSDNFPRTGRSLCNVPDQHRPLYPPLR